MKIGQFAECNNISIDSIRHYMDMGLLLPEKKGSQYYFDKRCSEDIKDIIELKTHGFSLNEIRDILYIQRLATPIAYEKNQYYKGLYENKYKEVLEKLRELKKVENKLSEKINEIFNKVTSCNNIGLDINVLSLLVCPLCNRNLLLEECHVKDTQIFSGLLKCKCGRCFSIEDGIIISDKSEFMENPFGSDIEKFFIDYLKESNEDFINILTKDIWWLSEYFKKGLNENLTVLELGVGYGVFLRNVYESLLDNMIYIAIDHNISILKSLKEMLTRINPNKRVIFICTDVMDIPIRQETIDTIIDVGGVVTHNSFLLQDMDKYTKDKAAIFGSYIINENLPMGSVFQGLDATHFTLRNVKGSINKIKYNIIEDRVSKEFSLTGRYGVESDEKNKIKIYTCFLKR